MLGGWKVEGVSELSDLILQSAAGAGIVSDRLRGRSVELEVGTKHGDAVDVSESNCIDWCQRPS